jgi:cell division protein FtsB
MIEQKEPPRQAQSKDRDWSLPSWSKGSDFVLNVVQLQRTYEGLKADNVKLKEQVDRLQRQADEQAGELKILLSFVQTSLRTMSRPARNAPWRACLND